MCKFIGKSNERILCKLSKSEILRLYSIVHVAMETTKTSNFACQSKSFIIIFFTCQVSACELQPFSRHELANDLYSETAKTVFSHLKSMRVKSMFNVWTIKIHAVKINLFSKISNLSEKKQEVKVEENKVTEATPVSKILNILVLYFFCNFYQRFVVDFFCFLIASW